MVLVVGNRILGGIGAPGGGMSEAFGTGVNTALDQRTSRQAMSERDQLMRMREQEFTWKREDREEAKRRRAAAAAAAAAAKARNKAALAAITTAQPFFRIGAQPATAGATAPVAPRSGANPPLSMGTPAPAPAPVSGGGGTAGLRGGAGEDNLPITNVQFVQGTLPVPYEPVPGASFNSYGDVVTTPSAAGLSARPGNFAAQATERALAQQATGLSGSPAAVIGGYEAGAAGSLSIPRMEAALADLRARMAAEVDARAQGGVRFFWQKEDLGELGQQISDLTAKIKAARMQPATDLADRGVLALEGGEALATPGVQQYATEELTSPPGTVTIRGPNGPMTVPVANMGGDAMRFPPMGARPEPEVVGVPAGGVPAQQADLGFGLGSTDLGFGLGQSNLTFGERLGAARTPTQMFLADLGRTPSGSVDLGALVAQQNSPLYDSNFSASAEQERAMYAYMAQDAMERGNISGYVAAVGKVRELETLILTQQLMVGVQEATNFGSAQRLSQVMSMVYGGKDVAVIPKGNGLGDIYVDGRLQQSDADLAGKGDQLLRMIDNDYRAQAAAAEAERAKKVSETNEAIRQQIAIDTNKAQLESNQKAVDMALAVEQAFGIGMGQLRLEQIKEALIQSGKLPGPPEKYDYQKVTMSDGSEAIAAFSNGRPVAFFTVGTVEVNGKPQMAIQEIGE